MGNKKYVAKIIIFYITQYVFVVGIRKSFGTTRMRLGFNDSTMPYNLSRCYSAWPEAYSKNKTIWIV